MIAQLSVHTCWNRDFLAFYKPYCALAIRAPGVSDPQQHH